MRGAPPPEQDEEALRRAQRKRRFFLVRVATLLLVLFVVVLYAIRDFRSRRERNEWSRTVDVAFVVVHVDGTAAVDAGLVEALRARAAVLEERLHAEAQRHRAGLPRPFRIRVLGPVDVRAPAPTAASNGPIDLAAQAWNLHRWLGEVDPRASVEPDLWDTRIYVCVRRPASDTRSVVEGQSQEGGRIGVVDVELDDSMVDLTLIVATHELMHSLGATDKYDAAGRTRVPEGLAEPNRVPLYPQRFAEIMARNRPVSGVAEAVPDALDQVAVGAATAREIGWLR